MNFITAMLIICVVYLLYKRYYKNRMCNSIDDRCYEVSDKFVNSADASVLLANINIYCIKLLRHLRGKFMKTSNDKYIKMWQNNVAFLLSNYNPDNIIENTPTGSVNTSYVDEKGKVFAICLREKLSGNNNFQNMHDLHFVVLHELTHMATQSYGHEDEFWTNFKFILTEAKEAGIHTPVDYSKYPINYCKLDVNYNPYFDNTLKII